MVFDFFKELTSMQTIYITSQLAQVSAPPVTA